MKKEEATEHYPLERLAQFLEEHPAFSPQVEGEDAVVCGFQIGECFLRIEDMEWLFATPDDSRLPRLLAVSSTPVHEV